MIDGLDYEIIRRELSKPHGGGSMVFYDIAVVAPTRARSIQMDKSYQTEA